MRLPAVLLLLLATPTYAQQAVSPLAPPLSIAVETPFRPDGLPAEPVRDFSPEVRVATATKTRGLSNKAYWWTVAAAGAIGAGDLTTTWDSTVRRKVGVEGNRLLADEFGHPRFGAIAAGKLGVIGLSLATRKCCPTFSRWLLYGSIAGAAVAIPINTTVGRRAR